LALMQMSPLASTRRSHRGFTLVEVLTTLGVMGVSLSLVVPTFSSLTRTNLRATAINELVGTLHVARSEAITRNAPVVICPSADGHTCARVAWEAGWIRFVDGDGNYQADAGEAVLGAEPAIAGLSIRSEAFGTAFGYTPKGHVSVPGGRTGGGDFTFCASGNGAEAQVVLVSPLGQLVLADRLVNGREPDCSLT
jgi:type IV fimbrial biogenesis protein FimT